MIQCNTNYSELSDYSQVPPIHAVNVSVQLYERFLENSSEQFHFIQSRNHFCGEMSCFYKDFGKFHFSAVAESRSVSTES